MGGVHAVLFVCVQYYRSSTKYWTAWNTFVGSGRGICRGRRSWSNISSGPFFCVDTVLVCGPNLKPAITDTRVSADPACAVRLLYCPCFGLPFAFAFWLPFWPPLCVPVNVTHYMYLLVCSSATCRTPRCHLSRSRAQLQPSTRTKKTSMHRRSCGSGCCTRAATPTCAACRTTRSATLSR